jgi:DNA gyrase subunit A
MCIRFNERDVRPTGRTSMGVIGMTLTGDDQIIGMQLNTQGEYLLFVSENGLGKRTVMDEFSVQRRGGKGVKCYKITEKTGDVIGVKAVNDDNEVMLITTEGIIIRLVVSDISVLGRITSGVKLMNIDIDTDIKVANLTKVRESNTTTSDEDLIKNLEKELDEEDQVIDTSDLPVLDYLEDDELISDIPDLEVEDAEEESLDEENSEEENSEE